MRERVDRRPDMMRLRRDTVEHPFGTLKRWMGAEHFLTKGLHNVGTEMSLQVLAYTLKRVMNILGVEGLLRALYTQDFHYIVQDDEYQCPASERLRRRTNTHDRGKPVARYWTLNCGKCALKPHVQLAKNVE